jgi:PKHD-type hydroxylase
MVYPRVFTAEECDALIGLGEESLGSHGPEAAGIEGVQSAGELRDSEVGWVPRTDGSQWAFGRLEDIAGDANQVWGMDVESIVEDLQYTLYDRPGAHYTWHHDGLDVGVADRKISLVTQLTDPVQYTGGDLEFLEVAVDYDGPELAAYLEQCRSRGTVVAFCSFEYHRVTPLVTGERRSMVAWLSGPPLR